MNIQKKYFGEKRRFVCYNDIMTTRVVDNINGKMLPRLLECVTIGFYAA